MRSVMDFIGPNPIGSVKVRPQRLRDRRISVADLEANAVAGCESISLRFQADLKLVDNAGLERLFARMRMDRHFNGATLRIQRAMGGAKPPAADHFESWVDISGKFRGRIGLLIGELYEKIRIRG